jgi:hypothetical protein
MGAFFLAYQPFLSHPRLIYLGCGVRPNSVLWKQEKHPKEKKPKQPMTNIYLRITWLQHDYNCMRAL